MECNTCYRTLHNEGRNPTLVRTLRWLFKQAHLSYDPTPHICPTGALTPPQLEWPRSLRVEFSDPTIKHSTTGVQGRGTEEIKTNDVTNRLGEGDIGLVVELGRPGLGARLRELEKVAKELAKVGVRFEQKNPVTYLMVNRETGERCYIGRRGHTLGMPRLFMPGRRAPSSPPPRSGRRARAAPRSCRPLRRRR